MKKIEENFILSYTFKVMTLLRFSVHLCLYLFLFIGVAAIPSYGLILVEDGDFMGLSAVNSVTGRVYTASLDSLAISAVSNGSIVLVAPTSNLTPFAEAGAPRVSKKAVAYPNPFRFPAGTEIGYHLNQNLDIEILIFNMFGQMVYKRFCPSGANGGSGSQYNKVAINASDFGGGGLPSGLYVFFIMNAGKILDKGKMTVGL
jgi:hypothetical protein